MFVNPLHIVFAVTLAIALVISSALDIHRAFKTINEGLVTSSQLTTERNQLLRDSVATYGTLNQQQQLEGLKYIKNDCLRYINVLTGELLEHGEGINAETGDFVNAADTAIVKYLFIETLQGDTLSHKLDKVYILMLNMAVSDDCRIAIRNTLRTSTLEGNWNKQTFDGVPLSSAVTILRKLENDIYSAEEILLTDILNSNRPLSSKPATAQ